MALVLGDNFSYQGAKPLDGRIKYDTLANMKAVADATMYDGCLAYCSETDKTYQWKSTNTVDETLGRWREFSSGSSETTDYPDLTNKPSINDVTLSGNKTSSDLGLQAEMQLSTMPTADADYLGKTVQYVGATENGYTHNYFYECVSDGESTPTYSWQQSNVQPSNGGGGGHTIEDSEGTDLTQRDTMQFGTGFNATDDSENEKTVITPDVMQSGDMDDVLTPLPSVAPKKEGIKYSTTEQVIGEWIDGKPIYQKTWTGLNLSLEPNSWVNSGISNSGIEQAVSGYAYSDTNGVVFPVLVNPKAIGKTTIQIAQTRATTITATHLTLQYTKTT